MKKIAINCRILNKRHGGPRRFLMNVLSGLAKYDLINEYYLILNKRIEVPFDLPKNFRIIILESGNRFIYEYIKLPLFINRLKPDLFFVSDPCFSPFIRTEVITVIHDIIYFEKEQEREFKFFENLHHKLMIPICGKRAKLNVCVSKFTESRVKILLGLTNTRVLHEGVEDIFNTLGVDTDETYILEKYNIKKPYIFFLGSMSPRKNCLRLIRSFLDVEKNVPQNLYLLGGYSWRDEKIKKILSDSTVERRVKKVGYIEESDLPVLYRHSDYFVYPSLYEGFGLPILEAQACGCPVITSNIGATKEVSGDSAFLVNPLEEEALKNSILRLSQDVSLRAELKKKGMENIKRFSWHSFVFGLMEIFNET